jgi:hypothetical protein
MTSKTQEGRHLRGQVSLIEYFNDSEERLEEVLSAVQHKVVGVFLSATDPLTGRGTGQDNCICGLSDKRSDLVDYVASRIRLWGVFGHKDAPKKEVKLNKYEWEIVIRRVHKELVLIVIEAMLDDHSLYRLNSDWCFLHELRRGHDRMARAAKEAFRNNRNFHGLPDNQGRRRTKQHRPVLLRT